MGFIGCSEREPSWLSEFSEFSVAGGWLAGWIRWQCQISDINHQPLLLPSPAPLSAVMPFHSPLLHPTSSLEPVDTTLPFYWNSSSVSIYLHVYLHLCIPSCFPNSHAHTVQSSSRQADSAGFVVNGILLHIRRKCTLQCGFTNCLHCPGNDSLNTAENGSQPDSQKDRQHSANRQTSLQSLQANSTGQTDREADSL